MPAAEAKAARKEINIAYRDAFRGRSADFDRAVELTFHPNPAIRSAEAPAFCVAGPQVTPHVAAQQLVKPGESRRLKAKLEAAKSRAEA